MSATRNDLRTTSATFDRSSTVQKPGAQVYTFLYDIDSRRTTLQLGLGSTRQYQYDPAGRLTTQIELNAASNPIATFVDTYDSVGNRTRRNQDGAVTSWTYDDAYRLTGENKAGSLGTYVFDANGNLLVKQDSGGNPMTSTFDAANRLVTMQDDASLVTFTYDDNGNQTVERRPGTKNTTTYTYDPENRLVGAHIDVRRSTYTFDGDGLRRSKHEDGGSLTTMIWDGTDYLEERT